MTPTVLERLEALEKEMREFDPETRTIRATVPVMRYRMMIDELRAIAKELREIAREIRTEPFNQPGTPMWIRASAVDWAARLAPTDAERKED